MSRYIRDRNPRSLTAWKLNNDMPGTRGATPANIATEFAGYDAPKLKFMFTVSFEFGPTLSSLYAGSDSLAENEFACKNVTRPNPSINYAEVNSYNYRYKVATRTEYGTVSLTLYDDNKDTAHMIFSEYLYNISPVSRRERGTSYYNRTENIQEWASLGPLPTDEADGLIRSMRVTHHFNSTYTDSTSGHRKIHYDYINPKIQSFILDDLDMSVSDVSTIGLTFVYDSVNVVYEGYTGEVTIGAVTDAETGQVLIPDEETP